MTDADSLAAVARAAGELIPSLTERLARHGLAEIEVRHGGLRVRVKAGDPAVGGGAVEVHISHRASAGAASGGSVGAPAAATSHPAAAGDAGPGLEPVPSPAVGHFVYAEGLGPGLSVSVGAEIGYVEVLGVRHEVRAPVDGVVRHLVAESGEPVEYGQVLVEVAREGPG